MAKSKFIPTKGKPAKKNFAKKTNRKSERVANRINQFGETFYARYGEVMSRLSHE